MRTTGGRRGMHAGIRRACLLAVAVVGLAASTPLSGEMPGAGASIDYLQYSIGALVLIQFVLIVALVAQNFRRRRATLELEKHYSEMTHTARLALVGEITASIAHEVTQPLSAILSNVETAEILLERSRPDIEAVREILADIKRDDLRANEIVRRLRTLLRKRELQFERVDVNALASNVLTLVLADAVRRNILIRTALDPDLPQVNADPVHLQQVLLNLLLNAMDAMKGVPPASRWLEVSTGLSAQASVEVAITDAGHGMTADQLAKAFDSFFTTKEGGMGLGLSIAKSIVQAHGGAIWAEPRDTGGTVFRFTIPLKAA